MQHGNIRDGEPNTCDYVIAAEPGRSVHRFPPDRICGEPATMFHAETHNRRRTRCAEHAALEAKWTINFWANGGPAYREAIIEVFAQWLRGRA